MNKARFGAIGCGNITRKAFLPALHATSCAELVAVASRSRDKAREFASQFDCEAVVGYEALLARDDINVVYIATPIALHAKWAVAAAQTGKHVLCEKALATSVEETLHILDACEKHNVAVFEGFMYQFHPQHATVRRVIDEGRIGEPVLFQAWFGFPPLHDDDIRYRPDLGGGALLDAGSYTVHSARRFFGREPVHVHASLDNGDHQVDIHGSALLDFGSGQTAQIAFGFDNVYRNSYMVWGTKGVLTLSRAFSVPPTFVPAMVLQQQDYREERSLEPYDQFVGEIEAFCMGLDDENMRLVWLEDAMRQSRVLESIRVAGQEPG